MENIVGIVAEYNPFHNGHQYHLKQAKKVAQAEKAVVVMSGNYVQRGEPAMIDKYVRTKMALEHGADLVLELPTAFATSSAEDFSMAAIALLERTGIVNAICFGTETKDFDAIQTIAGILAEEPEEWRECLRQELKLGYAYPVARERALTSCLEEKQISEIMSSPNNILAIEYCKSLYKRASKITPVAITRQGQGYHSKKLEGKFASASAIRQALLKKQEQQIQTYVPKEAFEKLRKQEGYLCMEDFSELLFYKLWEQKEEGYEKYLDCNEELSNRIRRQLDDYRNVRQFLMLLKNRSLTYTRIQRVLLHILLDITKEEVECVKAMDYVPYVRVLGFRREMASCLQTIANNVPLITNPARQRGQLSDEVLWLFGRECQRSDLYYSQQRIRFGCEKKNEFREKLTIV